MLGILGGTFDPIHNGHLHIAEQALTHFDLSKVIFVPAFKPAQRTTPKASAHDRLNMVKLAVQNHENFIVDDREIQRQGVSYMIDTLKSLQSDYPEERLALILGYDAWEGFTHWHEWETILNKVDLIIAHRPGVELAHNAIIEKNHKTIHTLENTDSPLSATELRKTLATPTTMQQQTLSPAVLNYIRYNNLYTT